MYGAARAPVIAFHFNLIVHAEIEVAETIDYQNSHANALDNKHPEISAVGES